MTCAELEESENKTIMKLIRWYYARYLANTYLDQFIFNQCLK